MDCEKGIFLQDFLDLVHVFQKVFLPRLDEIKQYADYKEYREYKKPDLSAYQRLIQAVMNNDALPKGHNASKAAIYYLDRNLRALDYLYPPAAPLYFIKPRQPNRVDLEGYTISPDRERKAMALLGELLSADENINLKYDCEMIRRNFFAVFRTK